MKMEISQTRRYSFTLLLWLMSSMIATNVFGQRDKYIYNPDKAADKKATAQLPATEKKEIYRIDYLLPLSTKDLPDKKIALSKIPNASKVGVHFYEGVLMAIDSLEAKSNSYFDIFVHDVSSAADLDALIASKTLDSTDLIIGAVTSLEIKTLADFAAEHRINFLSVLSPATANVSNNPHFIILQPTLEAHLDKLYHYAEDKIGALPATIIYDENVGDYEVFSYYKRNIKRYTKDIKLQNGVLDPKDLINALVPGKKNIVYATMLSRVTAEHFLNKVKDIPTEFELEIIGLPSWKGLGILSQDSMPSNVNVYLSSPFTYDDDIAKMKDFQNDYKRFGRGAPSEYVFRGFETTLWACELLTNHGTMFNKNAYQQKGAFCDYNVISRYDDKSQLLYMENNSVNIYQYNEGKAKLVSE